MLVCADPTTPGRLARTRALAGLCEEAFGVATIVALPPPDSRVPTFRALVPSFRFGVRVRTVHLARHGAANESTGAGNLAAREGVTMALCIGVDATSDTVAVEMANAGIPLGVLIEDSIELGAGPARLRVLRNLRKRATHVLFGSVSLESAFERAVRGDRDASAAGRRADGEASDEACRTVLPGTDASDDAFRVLECLMPGLRRVSVVVPSFNYARYLGARLRSVFAQDYPIYETIVLDDASIDDSVREVRRVTRSAGRRVRLEVNATNGGSVFSQWAKGAAMASGELLWIAEADDLADPRFLSTSVAALETGGAVLSFCDSVQIDSRGKPLAASYDYYYRRVDPVLFDADFAMPGAELVRRALAERNVILNASAVLWRRDALTTALAACAGELERYRLVGDWCLYLEALCRVGARVVYVAAQLNVHRRHPSSVTHAFDTDRHLAEVRAMQGRARLALGLDPEREARVVAYLEELEVQFAGAPGQRAA